MIFFVKKIYFNFDVFWNTYISKSIKVKVLILATTAALCTFNALKKRNVYLIGVKSCNPLKTSYRCKKLVKNNTPTVHVIQKHFFYFLLIFSFFFKSKHTFPPVAGLKNVLKIFCCWFPCNIQNFMSPCDKLISNIKMCNFGKCQTFFPNHSTLMQRLNFLGQGK